MTDATAVEAEERALAIATDRATKRNELAEVKFGAQGGQLFVPRNGRELMDMSNLMAQAGLMVKDIYRGNAGACMALIAVCAPYGLNPLQVSWKTYQTKPDAPIAYEAQVIVAMLNSSGVLKGGSLDYEFFGEGRGRYCVATGTLKNGGAVKAVQTPPLSQIGPQNSPLWKTDPDQQLAYYAGRAWARRHRPEMLLGIYAPDEEPAIGPDAARDVTPRPGRAVYRDVEEQKAQPPAERETAQETKAEPEVDPEHRDAGVTDAEVVDEETGEVTTTTAPATDTSEFERIVGIILSEVAARPGANPKGVLALYADEIDAMRTEAPDVYARIADVVAKVAA
jgi:hypothetical protein